MLPIGELRLYGTLKEYSSYDFDHSGGVSSQEANALSDASLAQILDQALSPDAASESNRHLDFFIHLPQNRLMRLFENQENTVAPYFHEAVGEEDSFINRFLYGCLEGDRIGYDGEATVDRFLLSGIVTINQWPYIFKYLWYSKHQDYIYSRAHVRIAALPSPIHSLANFLDADSDGWIKPSEIDQYPSPMTTKNIVLMNAFHEAETRVASMFLIWKMDLGVQANFIMGSAFTVQALRQNNEDSESEKLLSDFLIHEIVLDRPNVVQSLILLNRVEAYKGQKTLDLIASLLHLDNSHPLFRDYAAAMEQEASCPLPSTQAEH